jgi:hypothetical protein
MREDWERFDRRHGHWTVRVMVPWADIARAWKWVFGAGSRGQGAGSREGYAPDEIDRAIDRALEE